MHSYTKKESNASTFFHDFKNMPLAIQSGIFFIGFPLNSACAFLNFEKKCEGRTKCESSMFYYI